MLPTVLGLRLLNDHHKGADRPMAPPALQAARSPTSHAATVRVLAFAPAPTRPPLLLPPEPVAVVPELTLGASELLGEHSSAKSDTALPPLHLAELLKVAGGCSLDFAGPPPSLAATDAHARLDTTTPHTLAWMLAQMCCVPRVDLGPMLRSEHVAARQQVKSVRQQLRPEAWACEPLCALEALRVVAPPLLPSELRMSFLAGLDLLRGSLVAADPSVVRNSGSGGGKKRAGKQAAAATANQPQPTCDLAAAEGPGDTQLLEVGAMSIVGHVPPTYQLDGEPSQRALRLVVLPAVCKRWGGAKQEVDALMTLWDGEAQALPPDLRADYDRVQALPDLYAQWRGDGGDGGEQLRRRREEARRALGSADDVHVLEVLVDDVRIKENLAFGWGRMETRMTGSVRFRFHAPMEFSRFLSGPAFGALPVPTPAAGADAPAAVLDYERALAAATTARPMIGVLLDVTTREVVGAPFAVHCLPHAPRASPAAPARCLLPRRPGAAAAGPCRDPWGGELARVMELRDELVLQFTPPPSPSSSASSAGPSSPAGARGRGRARAAAAGAMELVVRPGTLHAKCSAAAFAGVSWVPGGSAPQQHLGSPTVTPSWMTVAQPYALPHAVARDMSLQGAAGYSTVVTFQESHEVRGDVRCLHLAKAQVRRTGGGVGAGVQSASRSFAARASALGQQDDEAILPCMCTARPACRRGSGGQTTWSRWRRCRRSSCGRRPRTCTTTRTPSAWWTWTACRRSRCATRAVLCAAQRSAQPAVRGSGAGTGHGSLRRTPLLTGSA